MSSCLLLFRVLNKIILFCSFHGREDHYDDLPVHRRWILINLRLMVMTSCCWKSSARYSVIYWFKRKSFGILDWICCNKLELSRSRKHFLRDWVELELLVKIMMCWEFQLETEKFSVKMYKRNFINLFAALAWKKLEMQTWELFFTILRTKDFDIITHLISLYQWSSTRWNVAVRRNKSSSRSDIFRSLAK